MDRYKFFLIASSGGHLHQLAKAANGVEGELCWITEKTIHTKTFLKDEKHLFIINPHLSKFKYVLNALQALFYLLKQRPKVIISTGAGIAIPIILLGKYLFGCKIIFIESAADVSRPAKTPAFIYKHADLFYVQWEDMLKVFPQAKYKGLL